MSCNYLFSLSSWDVDPGLAGSPHWPTCPQHLMWTACQGCLSPPTVENIRWSTTLLWSFVAAHEFTGRLQSSHSERCPLFLHSNSCCGWRAASMTERRRGFFCTLNEQSLLADEAEDEITCGIFKECLCRLNVQHWCWTSVVTADAAVHQYLADSLGYARAHWLQVCCIHHHITCTDKRPTRH